MSCEKWEVSAQHAWKLENKKLRFFEGLSVVITVTCRHADPALRI